jgi:hypothetical protein
MLVCAHASVTVHVETTMCVVLHYCLLAVAHGLKGSVVCGCAPSEVGRGVFRRAERAFEFL